MAGCVEFTHYHLHGGTGSIGSIQIEDVIGEINHDATSWSYRCVADVVGGSEGGDSSGSGGGSCSCIVGSEVCIVRILHEMSQKHSRNPLPWRRHILNGEVTAGAVILESGVQVCFQDLANLHAGNTFIIFIDYIVRNMQWDCLTSPIYV